MDISVLTNVIGTIAAFLTTTSLIPQALRTFRTRDVAAISLPAYAMFCLGLALWFTYGLLLKAWPIIIANGISLSLALCILSMCIRYRRTHKTAESSN